MNLSTTILGSTTVKQLQATSSAWVLEVGSDRLTRGELAAVGCYNFVAAKNLSATLKPYAVKSLADLFTTWSPTDLALPRLGVISLAVLGAAFEAKGIGGEMPLEKWAAKHTPGNGLGRSKLVTFHTIKHRELVAMAKERAAKKSRKGVRRDQAHGLRVARFTERQQHATA